MHIFLFIVVLAVSYAIGVFGFCQIIGSLQNIRVRSVGMTAFTIIFWLAILVGAFFFAYRFLSEQIVAYYIGIGLSFLSSLGAGKIT